MTDQTKEIFGEPIFTYTDEQAVEDGVLVHPFPRQFPNVLLSNAIYEAIEAAPGDRTFAQKAIPLIQDAIMIVNKGPRDEYLWTKGLEGNVTNGEVWIARNGSKGITLMRPSDY